MVVSGIGLAAHREAISRRQAIKIGSKHCNVKDNKYPVKKIPCQDRSESLDTFIHQVDILIYLYPSAKHSIHICARTNSLKLFWDP